MLDLFARARNGLSLTPAERSLLKLIEGLAVAGLVAAMPVLAEALSSRGTIVWNDVLHSALAAGITAVLMALLKYAKASGELPFAGNVASSSALALSSEPSYDEIPPDDTPPASAALQPAA